MSAESHPGHGGHAPKLAVQSLGSGSSGNALLVEYEATAVLVDCGVGIRDLRLPKRSAGRVLDKLDAVLVTHEHVDHIRSLHRVIGPGTPVVATVGTAAMAGVPASQHVLAAPDRPVTVGALTVWALAVKHDSVEPCGYLIETPTGNITVLTDLGSWHDSLTAALRHSDLVVLEANHDLHMLRSGPYPPHLKRRVVSDVGHLANDACGRALAAALAGGSAPTVWLAHLSATNNRPETAVATVTAELARRDLTLPVCALPRRAPGPRWESPGGVDRGASSWQPPLPTQQLQLELG